MGGGKPPPRRPRSARRHLELAAAGVPVAATTFRTAPLPVGVVVPPWEDCECGYIRPTGPDGKPLPHGQDPPWQWLEDPTRTGHKRSLRTELTVLLRGNPRKRIPPTYPIGHFHSGDARAEQPGFPDFLLWSEQPVPAEAWELKRMGESASLAQATHAVSLRRAGFTVRLVRPCCLLAGVVDELLAVLYGVDLADPQVLRSGYARQPGATASPALRTAPPPTTTAAAAAVAVVERLAPRTPPAPRPPVVLPGAPAEHPDRIAGAVGYTASLGDPAVPGLEAWLRDNGFPPTCVPLPIRVILGASQLAVQCRAGHGHPRVWRSAPVARLLPHDLAAQLTAIRGDNLRDMTRENP